MIPTDPVERKAWADKIWKDVQENRAKLDGCPLHEFKWTPEPGTMLRRKFTCTKCGGTVDSTAHHWYTVGLRHAMSHPGPPPTPINPQGPTGLVGDPQ